MRSRVQPPLSEESNVVLDVIPLILLAMFGKANRDVTYRSGGHTLRISPPPRRWFR